jgi:hypothetical protein
MWAVPASFGLLFVSDWAEMLKMAETFGRGRRWLMRKHECPTYYASSCLDAHERDREIFDLPSH